MLFRSVYAVDRAAPDPTAHLLAAHAGARWLSERMATRMQASITRLRTLSAQRQVDYTVARTDGTFWALFDRIAGEVGR